MTVYLVSKTTKEHFLARNFSPADANDEDLTLVKGDADGWIKWHGAKERPVPGGSQCEVRIGTRYTYARVTDPESLTWREVRAYRPILDEPQAPKDSVTVKYDLDPVRVEGAIRDKLIEMGWTPPPMTEEDEAVKDMKRLFDDGVLVSLDNRLRNIYRAGYRKQPDGPHRRTGGDA